jgi:hypothetical protein
MMARLLATPYPMPEPDYANYDPKTDKATLLFEKLCAERDVLSFPVADNYAHYLVVTLKPLVLQYVPYMDGYRIDAAHIRGLRTEDAVAQIRRRKAMDALFTKKETAK